MEVPSTIQEDACGLCEPCKSLVWCFIGFLGKPMNISSFLSSILLTENYLLISLYIYISLSPRRPRFGCPGFNRGCILVRVHVSASSGKVSRHSCPNSREGSLNVKLERNSRGRATIKKDPKVPIHSRYT